MSFHVEHNDRRSGRKARARPKQGESIEATAFAFLEFKRATIGAGWLPIRSLEPERQS